MPRSLQVMLLVSMPLFGSVAIASPDIAVAQSVAWPDLEDAISDWDTSTPTVPLPNELALPATGITPQTGSIQPQFSPSEPTSSAFFSVSSSTASAISGHALPALPMTDLDAPSAMSQLTSVDQLSDVQPTDWAYQALRSLIERYGVISGYPNNTFRGNRPLSRYEFAAVLLAALDRIQELFDQGLSDTVERDDLATLLRLQTEFSADLAILGGRMRMLESRTAEVEATRFSTTTKLHGEAIFSLAGQLSNGDSNRTVLRDRLRLDLVTSFTGGDRLNLRLAAGSAIPFSTPGDFANVDAGTAEGTLVSRIGGNTDNDVVLDWLAYSLPIGDRIQAYISAAGGIHSDYVPSTFSPLFEDFDGGNGSISAFSQQSPIYRIGGGAGIGLTAFLDQEQTLAITGGYLADEAASPASGSGLFNGDYAALGQLSFTPGDRLQLGLTYVHGYHTEDNFIFDLGDSNEFYVGTVPANAAHIELDTSAVTNSYGFQAAYRINSRFTIHTFLGYTDIALADSGDGEIWYYGIGFGFPDLLLPGSLGGLMIGVEPYLGGIDGTDLAIENDTSLHLEAFYKLRLSDYLSLTPGIIWISAPNQDAENADIVVGVFRATFSF